MAVSLLPVSIMFVLHQTTAYNLVLIGRILAGLLYGITLMTFLLHIADNSSQFMRRYLIWTIPIISAMPTVLFAETISTITNIYDLVATTGVLMFVLAIVTLIFMPCTHESIIFLLESGNDLRALEIMLKLRNESRHFIRRDFNEFKMMLAEDISEMGNVLSTGNYRPLFAVLMLRVLNAITTSNSIYWIFLANVMVDIQNWTVLSPWNTPMVNETATTTADNDIDMANISRFYNETEYTTEPILFDTTPLYHVIDDDGDIWNVTDIGMTDGINSTATMPMNSTVMIDSLEEHTLDSLSLSNGTLWVNEVAPFIENISAFIANPNNHSLSMIQLAQFLLIVFAVKFVVGIVLMCVAEKFQIFRNRVILKATLWIGLINATFFLLTLICYRFDDNMLLFTFYMSKLVNILYGSYLLITFAIDTIGYCELAESFSLETRYRYIATILICEHFIYAGAILLIMNALCTFYLFVIQSILVCVICWLLLRCMPNDCLNRTLRGARDKYFVKIASTDS